LGDEPEKVEYFKAERAEAFQMVDASVSTLEHFSTSLSDSDRQRLDRTIALVAELRIAHQTAEEIAQLEENFPARQLFRGEILPRIDVILDAYSSIIEAENVKPVSIESRNLLKQLANNRFYLCSVLSDLQLYLGSGSAESRKSAEENWHLYSETYSSLAQSEAPLTQQQEEDLARTTQSLAGFQSLMDRLFALRESVDWNKAQYALETTAVPAARSLKDEVGRITLSAETRRAERLEQMESAGTTVSTTLLIATVAAILLATAIATFFSRKLVGMVRILSDQAEQIAQGNLTGTGLNLESSDELGQLAQGFDRMLLNLKDLTGQILQVTENVNSAASQISSSATQQAISAKQQSSTVQEITSTMREISQTGAQIIDKAREVAAVAEASTEAGKSGISAVQDANLAMEAIREQVEDVAENIVALSEKTQAIGDIVSTVNEVAEQSNLLALNATIEAVSAGEHGNRFSVVANEMKNLADQAKQCTVQVRDILGEIQKGINSSVMLTEEAVKRVESGKKKAEATESSIRQMCETTDDSVQAFQQIIGSTNQQQVGFEQVTKGMEEIREATVQTATGTSQLEQAVSSLSGLSQQLKTAVGSYRL
jgi:methyl-accepting chemotaxis protein